MSDVPPDAPGGQPADPTGAGDARADDTEEVEAPPGGQTGPGGPWGPWGHPGWGPGPWQQAGAPWGPPPGATPPWGTPPSDHPGAAPPGPPPWGGWTWAPNYGYGWGPAPPHWRSGARHDRPGVPWVVVAAAVALLALVGLGVGIGYSVWGSTASAPASSGPRFVHPALPSGGSGARQAFLGVELSAGGAGAGSGTAATPGAHVLEVVKGSPAAKAGIVAGDTITAFGTRAVASAITLEFDVQNDTPGERVKVGWKTTAGTSESSTVTLASRANRSLG